MLNIQTTATFNAQVTAGNNVVVVLRGEIPEEGNVTINCFINDRNLFAKNKEKCLAEMAEFQERVLLVMEGGKTDEKED